MKANKYKPKKTDHAARFLKIALILTVSLSLNGYSQKTISKIAFGSCGREDHALPIFDVVVKHKPDLFIFLGDNIYGDTKDMDTLQLKYNMLAAKPTFQNLKKNVNIIATRDDHTDKKYGIIGTPTRDKYEEDFENFKIGVPIQEARKQQNLTQEELAMKCGTTKKYIFRIENNASDI